MGKRPNSPLFYIVTVIELEAPKMTALTPGALLTEDDMAGEFTERQGIRMAAVGDDGDIVLVFGHHGRSVTVKAINEFLQRDLGWDTDGVRMAYDTPRDMGEALQVRWARFAVGDGGIEWNCDWSFAEAGPGLLPVMVLDIES